ncbi:MAG: type II secretion system protein [Acidobacteriaceae bacterium]|nr:type II secretion system protein [Acidobacteriaceae bacterium]
MRKRDTGEGGFVLLAVLFLVALILIGLAVAAPKMAQDIQRDKETEFYHRGLQYARAIRLYYRKTGNYPTDLAQLENTNNIRFLRKRYVDPITGQPFRIMHQGEAKAPLLGLFGQPLPFQPPGTTPVGNPVGTPIGGTQNGPTTGINSFGTSPFAGNPNSSSSITSSSSSPITSSSSGPTTSSDGTSTTGTGTAAGAFGSTTGSSTNTGFGSTGTVVGPIIGVSSTSPKESIRVYKKQTHYNQWEFVYDPNAEALGGGGIPQGGINGQPGLNGPGTPTNPAQGTNPSQGPTGFQVTPQPSQPTNPTSPQ